MAQKVFVDANVLVDRCTRDWLFLIRDESFGGMFQVLCTEDVFAETTRALRRMHPEWPGGKITRLRELLRKGVDVYVEDFPGDLGFPGTDVHDTHVHAAALGSGADILLTFDRGFLDLPDSIKDTLDYEIFSPDDFFVLLDDSAPWHTLEAARKQVEYRNKNQIKKGLCERLEDSQCPNFAARVKGHLATLSGPEGVRKFRETAAAAFNPSN